MTRKYGTTILLGCLVGQLCHAETYIVNFSDEELFNFTAILGYFDNGKISTSVFEINSLVADAEIKLEDAKLVTEDDFAYLKLKFNDLAGTPHEAELGTEQDLFKLSDQHVHHPWRESTSKFYLKRQENCGSGGGYAVNYSVFAGYFALTSTKSFNF